MAGNRPEARPLSLDVLDHYQIEAIERISGTLLNALNALDRISSNAPEPDRFRASNNFFLSGEAGGGKTTVYLSLREALEQDDPFPKNGKKAANYIRFKKLHEKRRRLVWLEPLDLEPAPEVGNLLAAVLVRLEDKIGKEVRLDRSQRRRGLLEEDPRDFLQEYEQLQNDVVLAWEGNIPQRAEHIDPEIYSLEVLRAVKASIQVNPRLQKALAGLLAEEGRDKRRLFVLPIDDLYLHPSSSIQLLRLLRMISVPQLFSLVMGDLDILEELAYQDILGKLVALGGERAFQRDRRQKLVLSSTANLLAATSLRKLMPAGQQYRLAVMHRLAALDFYPELLDPAPVHATNERQATLEQMLDHLPVNVPWAIPVATAEAKKILSLLDFLMLRTREEEGKDDDYYTYSGLAVLDLPPREVVDLWYSIDNVMPQHPVGGAKNAMATKALRLREIWKDANDETKLEERGFDASLGFIVEAANAAILGQTYIGKDDQILSCKAVRGHRGYKRRIFVTQYLRVEQDRVPLFKIPLEGGSHLKTSLHQGWFVYPNRSGVPSRSSEQEAPPEYMAPRPTAWLTVLHDLMALSGDDRLSGAPLTPDRFGFRLVEVTVNGRSKVWPTPRWVSFWHFDRLGFAWRHVGEKMRELKRKLSCEELQERLVYYWVRFITDILLSNRQEIDREPVDASITDEKWSKLIADSRLLLQKSERSEKAVEPEMKEMIRDWLIALKVMLSVEFTVPAAVSTRFEKDSSLDGFWKEDEQAAKIEAAQAEAESDGERGAS